MILVLVAQICTLGKFTNSLIGHFKHPDAQTSRFCARHLSLGQTPRSAVSTPAADAAAVTSKREPRTPALRSAKRAANDTPAAAKISKKKFLKVEDFSK